ncbi:hypothetical protein PAMA_007050 [Pampus argenteus]
MLLGRVLLSLRSTCSRSVCCYKISPGRSTQRLHLIYISYCYNINAFNPSANRISLKGLAQSCLLQVTVTDMQPASISYDKETTAVATDNNDDDDEEEGGGDGNEDVVVQERGVEVEELRKMITPGQLDAFSMKIQQVVTDTGASTLSVTSQESTQKKRKRKRGDIGGRVDSEEDADKKKKKKESQRPNYFVSIPITNTQISTAVIEVQEAVLQQEPRLAKAMIPVPTLHITLLVTHLANQEQVDLAATVLAQVEPSLAELLGGQDLVLPFSGIDHFRKEVVFVGLAPGQHRHTLDTLAGGLTLTFVLECPKEQVKTELLRSRFEEQGLLQGDNRGFEPHLTIMKLSRVSKLRSQGIKRVDPALFSSYTNRFFGDQTVERVDLCSMLKKKQQDGYYHTETSLQLG